MPFTVTEAQPTPNPNAMKYLLDRPICAAPRSYFNADAGQDDAIASQLFAIPGVEGILMLNDFVTVSKSADSTWKQITPGVKRVLADAVG